MEKKFIMLLLFLCSLFSSSAAVQGYSVSLEDALSAAKKEFIKKDADYYQLVDKDQSEFWYIFVDADPMKGWEHDSYLFTIP